MSDDTAEKVDAAHSSNDDEGQTHLAAGVSVAMRRWDETAGAAGEPHTRSYETVGYVIRGRATVEVDGRTVSLAPGDSWVVPAGATRAYTIEEDFEAIEATAPPARAQDA